MLNQMVKWTVIITMWRKYKRHVVATLVLLIVLFLINLLHQDFISFNQQQQTEYLALSYGVKWLSFIISLAVYFVVLSKINKAAKFDSTIHQMMSKKSVHSSQAEPTENKTNQTNSDPFANLRQKKKLRSKADMVIESQNQNK